MQPIFTSFEEAWRWFEDGGELVPLAAQRERFVGGRAQFLAFQVPIHVMPVADDVVAVQDELGGIADVALLSHELLHISIQGVGFQVIAKPRDDEILRGDVGRVSERAAAVLADTAPIEATIGPVNVFPDAVILEVHDGDALGRLRRRLGAAIGGEDTFRLDDTQYLPHVTIAAFGEQPAAKVLRARLAGLRSRPPFTTTIGRIELARWWFTGTDVVAQPEIDTVREYRLRG